MEENKSWRAMIIKDHQGDWALCVAQWEGMRKGISNGRYSQPGNPGHFSVSVTFLRDPKKPWDSKTTYWNDMNAMLEYINLTCKLSTGKISVKCLGPESLHRVALAFTLSTLYLLVQPRPEVLETPQGEQMPVPKVLLSGNHEHIRQWRQQQSLLRTWTRRPELLTDLALTAEQEKMLALIKKEAKQ